MSLSCIFINLCAVNGSHEIVYFVYSARINISKHQKDIRASRKKNSTTHKYTTSGTKQSHLMFLLVFKLLQIGCSFFFAVAALLLCSRFGSTKTINTKQNVIYDVVCCRRCRTCCLNTIVQFQCHCLFCYPI